MMKSVEPVITKHHSLVNLLGLSPKKLHHFMVDLGEKPFRAQQLLKWIYQFGVTDFAEMTNFSKALRINLSTYATILPPKIISTHYAKDGVVKWLIQVESGSHVECVFIPERGRGTLCISSQAGCILNCSFCSTGKQGFNSNLTRAEIIGQLWLANQSLRESIIAKKMPPITNVVMMGMGEPLLNFENVVDCLDIMMSDWGYGLSKRRVTLSTAGVVPAIYQLATVSDVSLAISLHAPNNELRNELVPLNKKYPIAVLLDAVHHYMQSLPDTHRVVTIEYTLIHGVNDQPEHVRELAVLLKDVPCKINLIPFNPFSESDYKRSSSNAIQFFKNFLYKKGFNVTVRKTRGEDINAACGQLAGQVIDRTKRRERLIALKQLKV